MQSFSVRTEGRVALIDITDKVERAAGSCAVKDGVVHIFVPHTTAAIVVSENWDPNLTDDILGHLEQLVPREANFKHGEGNAAAHILSLMLGTSTFVPIASGQLKLGRWQGIILAEFDGPRERTITVSVMPAA